MERRRCETPDCRRAAVGVWTNWGQGITVRTCEQHRYPVRSSPTKCWHWVRNPTVKYGVWEKTT